MNIKVEWNKIVANTLSVLVAAIIIGAATIVWQGATSVDSKVQETKEDVTFLIDTLSKKLARYEVQIDAQSNQLAEVITIVKGMGNFPPVQPLLGSPAPEPTPIPVAPKDVKRIHQLEQTTKQVDIREQLQLKR